MASQVVSLGEEAPVHEAAMLNLSLSANIVTPLSISAREPSQTLTPSSLYITSEVPESAARRMRNDEELQEAIGNVGGYSINRSEWP